MKRTKTGPRLFAPLVFAVALTLGLTACGGEQPSADSSGSGTPDLGKATIVIGGKVITWAPAYIAVCEGFFEQYGLQVEVVPSEQGTTSAIAGLVSGDVLSAMTGAPASVNAVRQGAPVQMLFNASIGYGVQVIAGNAWFDRQGVSPDADLQTRIQSLRGARIAILNPGDSVDQLLRYVLERYGLNPDTDVTITALNNYSNMIAALSRDEIDLMGGSPPNGDQVEQQDLGQIYFNGGEIEGLEQYPYLVGSANTRTISSDPAEVEALVKGIADALDLMRENPDQGKPCMREQFPDLDQATFDAAYEFTVQNVPESPLVTEEVFQALVDFSEASGNPIGVSYEDAVAVEIVQKALSER